MRGRKADAGANLLHHRNDRSAEVMAHLERCGVPVRMGPSPRAGAIGQDQSVYIDDPDQNSIEISTY